MILYVFILYNPTITISRMKFCSVLVSHMFLFLFWHAFGGSSTFKAQWWARSFIGSEPLLGGLGAFEWSIQQFQKWDCWTLENERLEPKHHSCNGKASFNTSMCEFHVDFPGYSVGTPQKFDIAPEAFITEGNECLPTIQVFWNLGQFLGKEIQSWWTFDWKMSITQPESSCWTMILQAMRKF